MGKSSTPAAPDYTQAAIATSNSQRYNEVGPYGSVTWGMREGADPRNPQIGDYTRTTTMDPQQQQLYDMGIQNQLSAGEWANQQIGALGDGQELADAMYRRSTQYYDQNFDRQADQLRTQLLNSGLAEGSQAYQNEMGQFNQRRDTAYADAADRAVLTGESGQNNAVQRLASILAMSRGQTPQSSNTGAGTDLLSALSQQYNAQVNATNASNASQSQDMQALAQLGMLGYLAFSDRRLKSNIVRVGEGALGLPVYEYDIASHRERGYMADEVELLAPAAVHRLPSGIQLVDYGMLGGRP